MSTMHSRMKLPPIARKPAGARPVRSALRHQDQPVESVPAPSLGARPNAGGSDDGATHRPTLAVSTFQSMGRLRTQRRAVQATPKEGPLLDRIVNVDTDAGTDLFATTPVARANGAARATTPREDVPPLDPLDYELFTLKFSCFSPLSSTHWCIFALAAYR